ncbi:hypothetical protein SBRY_80082 [Actinacidiphila bryophytorum]|uniref:Uncharacterized protein n=1 Tax=Actinacidiphila bryophytorum TaxID=1436133 RepID=A0A9W4MHM8_9ACTN|nr:hypothetical protein SBRY_80082 [Actinacidiphila bryophytorum]
MIATCGGLAPFGAWELVAQFPAPLKSAHPPAQRAPPESAGSAHRGHHPGARGTARQAPTGRKAKAHRKGQDLKGRGELRAQPARAERRQRTARGRAWVTPTGRKEGNATACGDKRRGGPGSGAGGAQGGRGVRGDRPGREAGRVDRVAPARGGRRRGG